ncbi:GIY-YIG nuclease family protein [Alteromonas antoniana]|uniref:GIY-YIG nuclease family protein n=1 Tax=Alteromonas antoniana TaxID=2803813 RepID=UPI001C45FA23|nr:GIY-YIG nuclease family protein [Alteromonas antoniana]
MSASIAANTDNEEPNSSRWYIYIIENRLGQFYTGITCDPIRRIAQHRGEKPGGAKALKGKSPLVFRGVFEVANKSQALKAEYRVKQLSRLQKQKLLKAKTISDTDAVWVSDKFAER